MSRQKSKQSKKKKNGIEGTIRVNNVIGDVIDKSGGDILQGIIDGQRKMINSFAKSGGVDSIEINGHRAGKSKF